MVASRSCEFVMADGSRCRAGPQRERPYCFAHDPERAAEAAEARKLGGLRRRKEGTIALAYDLPGLESVAGIRRLLQIVSTDGLAMDNGVPRLRVLISTAVAATNLLKVGEIEERLAAMEATLTSRSGSDEDAAFPTEAIR
jgi:hypothetical protein